jgi:hypothetical protein
MSPRPREREMQAQEMSAVATAWSPGTCCADQELASEIS